MNRIKRMRTSQRILIVSAIGVLILAAVFLSTQRGDGRDALSEALEGGELALTSVGRNYDSLTQFLQNEETESKLLLEAARVASDQAEAKLNSAGRTDDEYVQGMLNNFARVANASKVMSQGVDNLLFISANLTDALDYYSQKDFENASVQASYCLQVLTPLLGDFNASDSALKDVDMIFVLPGQKDKMTYGVNQYGNEMEIYNQIILFLRSISEGKDYLQLNAQLEEDMRQLQSALANKDYQTANDVLQKISETLQKLRDSKYQDAANLASQLSPSSLGGQTSTIAQQLQNILRNLEGLNNFGNYRQSLQKYLEASELYQQRRFTEAEQAIEEGLRILGQGNGSDQELQGMYQGLRDAFNQLEQRIKGLPDQG